MKIALVVPAFIPARGFGGPLYHVHVIAKNFQKKGHSVVIYTSNIASLKNSTAKFPEREYIDGMLVKRYRIVFKMAGYWITPSLLKALKNDNYDILHVHSMRSFQCDLSAFVSKLRRKPLIITAHGSLGTYVGGDLGLKNRALHIAHNIIAKQDLMVADKVIALNNFEKEQFLRMGLDGDRVVVIPNGVAINEFKDEYYPFKEKNEIRGKVVLFVGRLAKIKGLDILIRAFVLVKRQDLNAKLVVVGEDQGFQKELLAFSRRHDLFADILLLNHPSRDDIISAYQASDVVVLPSNYETFAVTLLEALACAKPVIATAVGGVPEIVSNGENGILVAPKDPEQLAKAIEYLLRNEDVARKMGLAGERLVMSQFSIDVVANKLEHLYKDVIDWKNVCTRKT